MGLQKTGVFYILLPTFCISFKTGLDILDIGMFFKVLEGRERVEPQEHCGQPRPLLLLLHLALRTRAQTLGH